MRQFNPIHRSGHVDVGEDEIDAVYSFEIVKCGVRVCHFYNFEVAFTQYLANEKTQ